MKKAILLYIDDTLTIWSENMEDETVKTEDTEETEEDDSEEESE